MVPNSVHSLSKNAIVHKLKKVFLKLIVCIYLDVMWTACIFLFWRFGISFSTFLIFILFSKNDNSLCLLHSSFWYSTSTKMFPCLYFFTSLSIFFRGKIINFLPRKSKRWQFLDHWPSIKYWRYVLVSSEFYWSFITLLLALALHFTAWIIPPQTPFSNICSMSTPLNGWTLNLTRQSLLSLFFASCSPCSSAVFLKACHANPSAV